MERAPTELKHGFVENAILVLLMVAFNANYLTLAYVLFGALERQLLRGKNLLYV